MNKPQGNVGVGFGRTLQSALLLGAGLATAAFNAQAATSNWANPLNGALKYQATPDGDRIMDFSWAGYKGGGVALPTALQVPAKRTVSPSGGDDTAAIQAAIDYVAGLAPDANGFRGAVQLTAGTFRVGSVVHLDFSGVVLRGNGSTGANATVLLNTNRIDHVIYLGGTGGYTQGTLVNMTDTYVPSGTHSFNASNPANFAVGDSVLITRTATAAWIEFVKMHNLIDNGVSETWMSPGAKMQTDRIVTKISGNQITVDAPLTDSFDAQYLGNPVGTISKYTFAGRISQSGVERLRIDCNNDGVSVQAGGITVDKAMDCWLSDVYLKNGYGAVNFERLTKRCTIDLVICENDVGYDRNQYAPPSLFSATGTQLLFSRCQAIRTNTNFLPTIWSFSSGSTGTGPIAILNFYSTHRSGVAPHQRWTTGFLVDSSTLPDAPSQTEGIAFSNRKTGGSGHGWVTGWSVAWNVVTPYLRVQQAPGTFNWSIGSGGTPTQVEDMGTFDSTGVPVTPSSLYLQQLQERLGTQAVFNAGYTGSRAGRISVEAESLARTSSGAGTSIQSDANMSGGVWVALDADGANDYVEYTFPNVPAGTYDISLAYKGHPNRGILNLKINGTQIGTTLDQYAAASTYTSRTFGSVTFASSGSHTIRLTCTGKNAAAGDFTLSADTLTVTPKVAKFSVAAGAVTASGNAGSYVPGNTVDGSLSTRWAANGVGQWIRYDLGAGKTVSSIKAAFHVGDTRDYYFDVQTSTDGTTWTTVLDNASSARNTALQTFDFPDTFARYVRLVCNGSSYDTYNNITEAEVWGY